MLSFQLYAQPFTFAGDYRDFRELRATRAYTFNVYGRDNASTIAYDGAANTYTADPDGAGPAPAFTFDNPDFRTRSLRSNAVLRWEYRPGSTLFVVWTQSRQRMRSSCSGRPSTPAAPHRCSAHGSTTRPRCTSAATRR